MALDIKMQCSIHRVCLKASCIVVHSSTGKHEQSINRVQYSPWLT